MRVQLVDMNSGEEICRKDDLSITIGNTPGQRSFALAGPDRRLAFCGGDNDGNCYLYDKILTGHRTAFIEGGPSLANYASAVTFDGEWVLIGTE